MAAKGDVKAVQITTAAQVFAGRTRLRGIILSNVTTTTTTGSVTLQDESGTQFTAEVPPGDVFSFNIPEDGILFKGGMTCSAITSANQDVDVEDGGGGAVEVSARGELADSRHHVVEAVVVLGVVMAPVADRRTVAGIRVRPAAGGDLGEPGERGGARRLEAAHVEELLEVGALELAGGESVV